MGKIIYVCVRGRNGENEVEHTGFLVDSHLVVSLINGGLTETVLLNDGLGLALLDCRLHVILSKLILDRASLVVLASLDCSQDSLLIDHLLSLALLDCGLEIVVLSKGILDLAALVVVLTSLDGSQDSLLINDLLLLALLDCGLEIIVFSIGIFSVCILVLGLVLRGLLLSLDCVPDALLIDCLLLLALFNCRLQVIVTGSKSIGGLTLVIHRCAC